MLKVSLFLLYHVISVTMFNFLLSSAKSKLIKARCRVDIYLFVVQENLAATLLKLNYTP